MAKPPSKISPATVNVTLKYPVEDAGVMLPALTIRRPKVRDQLTVQRMDMTDAEREITLFANLCEVTPTVIGDLDLLDYSDLQKAYQSFLGA